MSFGRELQCNRKLRKSFFRAILIVSGVFFLARFGYDYVQQYGWSLTPFAQGRVNLWPLLGWSAKEAAGGALSAWFGVYIAWKSQKTSNREKDNC